MVEAGAKELTEAEMLEAFDRAHEVIQDAVPDAEPTARTRR